METDLPSRGYYRGANKVVGMYDAFTKLAQTISEDQLDVTNLMYKNSNILDQVAIYANHLSSKEPENASLQQSV